MLKKVLLTVSGILLVVIVVIYFSPYRYLFKAVRIVYLTGHTSAFLSDYQYFHNEKVLLLHILNLCLFMKSTIPKKFLTA